MEETIAFIDKIIEYLYLSCVPSTSASAYQQLYIVYYQVQVWLASELHPEEWGLKLIDNSLEALQMLLPRYSTIYIRDVILCSPICTNRQSQSCYNVESNTTNEDSYDINKVKTDASFFYEQFIENQQGEKRR